MLETSRLKVDSIKDFYDAQETLYFSSCYCTGSAGRILQLILYVLSTFFAAEDV